MDALAQAWTTSSWTELAHEQQLNVTVGSLPMWLSGQYFLASSSGFECGPTNLTHAFDGYGKILLALLRE
jgi:carotenoid cleavage dioxygenase-like enzyme